jgi:hypothetical protein
MDLSFPLVGNPSLKKDSEQVGMIEKRRIPDEPEWQINENG